MIRLAFLLLLLCDVACAAERRSEVYDQRLADWRTHQVVYQVFVDRFAAEPDPASRAALYAAPRRLRPWTAQPEKGKFVPEAKVWGHELDFWGGTLAGVTSHLDYIHGLGANVLYLNPIFLSLTNHKYDTTDYFQVDPQFGTREDFAKLCAEAHRRGMRVVLDGVLNHVGERNPWFNDPAKRSFFRFDPSAPNGYVSWLDVPSMPELNYDDPQVRDVIYRKPDSVVQSWLKDADGWRLDVAFELGPRLLSEITAAAHRARADSYVTGEIYNYPEGWIPAMDGVMDMYLARIVIELTKGQFEPRKAAHMIESLIADVGIEGLLRSWTVLSNHDRPRLKSVFPSIVDRNFALVLQATLPGAPLFYYGEEIGLEGGDDPEQRGPMDWDAVRSGATPELDLTRRVIALRNTHRALQIGDWKPVPSQHLLAFTRYTASVRDTVLVLANPSLEPVSELIGPRDSFLMDGTPMDDALGGRATHVHMGLVNVTVPPLTVQVLVPRIPAGGGYDRYKRVP